MAQDGFPPCFSRRKGWKIAIKTAPNLELEEIPGLDINFRARLPDFNFLFSAKSSKPVIVGTWYFPFIFIKEVVDFYLREAGLSLEIVERMNWEKERFGWIRGTERQVTVKRMEQCEGVFRIEWRKYGCYVLVEKLVLKRIDGSLLLTYDFKHTHHVRSSWE